MLYILLFIGIILAIGYIVGKITHELKVTGIVGYILVGIILGPIIGITSKLGIGEEVFSTLWITATNFTLAFIAFIIGSHLSRHLFRELGKPIILMLLAESLGAFSLVVLGIYLYTQDFTKALLLGSLAPATAPAATVAVLHEYHAKGPLTEALVALVGWDDATAAVIFVIALAAIRVMLGGELSIHGAIIAPALGILGGLALGGAIGAILSFVVKKVKERESILIVSSAAVLMGAGLAELLDLSLILTCMAIGIAMVNLSPATGGASRGLVEGIMPPIYIVFFILAGMQFEFGLLYLAGILAVIYIVCRVAGKVLGISLTAKFSGAPTTFRKYLGFGMISQAGVAIGLAALLTTELAGLPEGAILATLGITVILATTIVFEIIGPIGVRYAIFKAVEARRK